jgi:DNA polymerase-3 subunit delta
MGKAQQANWRTAKPAALVFVSGPEEYLAQQTIRSIREQLKLQDSGLEVHEIDASSYAGGTISSLSSPSLFAEPRLITITSVEKCTDALIEDGIAYLANPSADSYLVLRHNGSSVRGKKLVDLIRSSDIAVEVACPEIKKDSERAAFIQGEFTHSGRKISTGAVRALANAFVDDLAELAAACSQLLSDETDSIDEAAVEKYYGGRVETNAFKVADAALAGQSAEALGLLRHALATGSDPVPLVAAFAMKIRLMAKVFGNKYATAANVGAQPWQIDRARKDLAGWSEEGLANAVIAIANADAAVKGAERDPVYALERLVLLLSHRGQKNTEA